jgi:hypothetical protein
VERKSFIQGRKRNFDQGVCAGDPNLRYVLFDLTNKGLCDQISAMVYRFWRAQQENKNKVHWISWETLSLPKKEGGLGYKDLHVFNMAMLAKQAWRILTNPSSLCA